MFMEKIYLPGLNGIRAFAASSVILCHIFLKLKNCGLERSTLFNYFASYGVTIFFTLSGFLITYLLLKEIQKTTKVSVKKFYMRRILRIWPLYFLFLIIVLVVMQFKVDFNIWFYVFILPNVPFAFAGISGLITTIPLLDHYWSLGVEEQFYAFWPWIFKFKKKIEQFMIVFILAFMILKFGVKFLEAPPVLVSFIYFTRFSCLVIGALGAYYFHFKKEKLLFVNNKVIDIASWALIFLMMLNVIPVFPIIANEIISILTLVIIFNQINNDNPIISLENKVLDYLGKISFGLYIYNPLIIYFFAFVFAKIPIENSALKIVLIILTNFTTIIVISHLSYFYFEKRFLKIKHRYTTVESVASNSNN
jgi:peptidoglycan/LPS O-acetylase OafA/YrhL